MIRKFKDSDTTKVMTLWTKGNFKANYFIDKDYWLLHFNQVKASFQNAETYLYCQTSKEFNDFSNSREMQNERQVEDIKGFISIFPQDIIGAIYVREDSQRLGIGKQLINYCKNLHSTLSLEVFEKNISAFLFFNAMDFKNIGIKLDLDTRRKKVYNAVVIFLIKKHLVFNFLRLNFSKKFSIVLTIVDFFAKMRLINHIFSNLTVKS